jgi:hypothetical protein
MTRRRLMGRPAGGRITGNGQTVFNSSASLRRTTLWLPHHAREVKFLSVASSRLDSGFCDHSFAGADGSLMCRSCPSKKLPDYAVFDKSVDRKSPTFTPPQSHPVIEACKPLLFIDFALVPGGGVEPPRPEGRRILSPLRLPVPPSRLKDNCLIPQSN